MLQLFWARVLDPRVMRGVAHDKNNSRRKRSLACFDFNLLREAHESVPLGAHARPNGSLVVIVHCRNSELNLVCDIFKNMLVIKKERKKKAAITREYRWRG